MPIFHYRAKKPNAESVEGEVTADTREAAIECIHELGLVPVWVEESGAYFRKKTSIRERRVTLKELQLFSHQLGLLLKSGVSLLRALEIVTVQSRNPFFQTILESIRLGIKGGKSFSQCLSEHPRIFSQLFIALAKAGEEGGRLTESIADVEDYIKRQTMILSKMRSALAYPLLMVFFGIGTIIFILTYVMPNISRLYVTLKQTLPVPTQIVMGISSFLVQNWVWILLAILAASIGISRWMRSARGKRSISLWVLNVPLLSEFWLKIELAQFSHTLALLLRSGIPIINALKYSIPVVSNKFVREELEHCQEELLAGRSFGVSLKRSKIIPDIMGHLMVVAEESGSLTGALQEIAETYEQETNEIIKVMTTLFEPLMIVLIGSIVGFIVIAMLMPIFDLDVFSR